MAPLQHPPQSLLRASEQPLSGSDESREIDQIREAGVIGRFEDEDLCAGARGGRSLSAVASLLIDQPASDLELIPNPTWHYRDRHGR